MIDKDRAEGVQDGFAAPKILIYSINYAPEITSTGRYAGELAAELVRLGAVVEAIAAPPFYPGWKVRAPYRNWFSRETLEGVGVTRCPLYIAREVKGTARLLAPLTFALTSIPAAIWRLLRFRPDVFLCVEPTLLPVPIPALLAKALGTATVLHVQDLEVDAAFGVGHVKGGLLKRLAYGFERVTLRLFDRVITISEAMRRQLVAKGVPKERTAIVRNWVDLDRIRPLPNPNAYRDILGVPHDAFIVQYAGNVGAKQGLDVLCEAAELLENDTHIQIIIAGDGPDKDRLLGNFGHLPNISFYDLQPEEKLCEFLNMPDLHVILQLPNATDFALPSKLGGILASGRPLLVTADPNHELSQVLGDAATVVRPGDAGLLAEAIRRHAADRTDDRLEKRLAIARKLSKRDAIPRFFRELTTPLRPRAPVSFQ